VRARLADGASLSTIERETGVSRPTLRRLAREGARLVPVEVVEEVTPVRPLVLHGPFGIVVEASAEEIASVLRRLLS
jgi:hypothetical protein